MSSEDKLSGFRASWIAESARMFDHWMEPCESPIEKLFLAAWLVDEEVDEDDRQMSNAWQRVTSGPTWKELRVWAAARHGIEMPRHMYVDPADGGCGEEWWMVLTPQAVLHHESGSYRIDFALLSQYARIAIELDGHDFHERTKEQAKRDKSRDRALTKAGWRVVRFTGSEVYASPHGCVVETLEMMSSLYAHQRAQVAR